MSFLDHFESVRSCGNGSGQWMARCQAHDDHNHSLSIGRGNDRWLLHCQAGCWVGQVLACHGLDWNDLFDDEDSERNGRVNLGKIRGEWSPREWRPRLDMSGEALLPPKHIVEYWHDQLSRDFQARLYELKGWSSGTLHSLAVGWDGVRVTLPVFGTLETSIVSLVRYLPNGDPKALAIGPRSLYPDPHAYDPEDDLWLVEGEPDAISMTELGEPAVGIPGVGKWDETWPECFAGRRVTVCFDCDRQGREAARKWSSALFRAGVENTIVDLAPEADNGYDIGDALANTTRAGRVPELKAFLARKHAEAWTR